VKFFEGGFSGSKMDTVELQLQLQAIPAKDPSQRMTDVSFAFF
jgi:hypothetical protein